MRAIRIGLIGMAGLTALPGAAHAVADVSGPPANPTACGDVLAVERQWNAGVAARDPAMVAPLLRDDFWFIAPNGAMADKTRLLEMTGNTAVRIDPFVTEDVLIRYAGTSAIVTGRFRQTGSVNGTPFAQHYRYTDVYECAGGRWLGIAAHASLIPEPAR